VAGIGILTADYGLGVLNRAAVALAYAKRRLLTVAAEGRGHFEGERVGTPFPLLKCLRTHKTPLKLRNKIKTVLDSYLMPNQES